MTTRSFTPAAQRDLSALVNDVLGDMAFMITDPTQAALPSGGKWLVGEIRYRGPVSGLLTCWCSRPFSAQLAANLLGLDPGADDAQHAADDAMREFLNVLCGHLVTRWFGTEAVFNLSIPAVRESADAPGLAAPPTGQRCEITIDGEPLIVVHESDA